MNFNINNISEQLAFIFVSNYLKTIIQRLILIKNSSNIYQFFILSFYTHQIKLYFNKNWYSA